MDTPGIRYARARDGTSIAYRVEPGAGTPVLGIPWPGLSVLALAPEIPPEVVGCVEAIRSGRPYVTFDWRGLGFSGPIGDGLTVAKQATDLEAVCDALGEPVDVVAWCGAAFSTVTLAVGRPQLFRTLTLVAPDYEGCDSHYGPFWEMRLSMPEIEWFEAALRRGVDVPVAVARRMAQRLVEFAPEEASRAHMRAFQAGSLEGLLPRLSVPTAVLSNPASLRQSSRVAEAIPGCIFQLAEEHTYASRASGTLVRRAIDAHDPLLSRRTANEALNGNGLSARELEVLQLIAAGKSNRQIAEVLVLSEATVATHVRHILEKTGAANRAEAASWAVRNGLA